MDSKACHVAVHGVAKSQARLSNWTELSTDKMHWSYLFGSIIANNYTHLSNEHSNQDTEHFHHS